MSSFGVVVVDSWISGKIDADSNYTANKLQAFKYNEYNSQL